MLMMMESLLEEIYFLITDDLHGIHGIRLSWKNKNMYHITWNFSNTFISQYGR